EHARVGQVEVDVTAPAPRSGVREDHEVTHPSVQQAGDTPHDHGCSYSIKSAKLANMEVAQLAWGSVSDWVSVAFAAVTAAASATAYVLRERNRGLEREADGLRAELETRNLVLEEQQKKIDLERARASAFDELSDQARLVSSIPVSDDSGRTTYIVVNDSDSPIFDLEIKLYAGPKDTFTNYVPTVKANSRYTTAFGKDSSPFSCDLRFRDFRGQFWRRDGYGTLTPLEGYVSRVRAVPPGYFDGD